MKRFRIRAILALISLVVQTSFAGAIFSPAPVRAEDPNQSTVSVVITTPGPVARYLNYVVSGGTAASLSLVASESADFTRPITETIGTSVAPGANAFDLRNAPLSNGDSYYFKIVGQDGAAQSFESVPVGPITTDFTAPAASIISVLPPDAGSVSYRLNYELDETVAEGLIELAKNADFTIGKVTALMTLAEMTAGAHTVNINSKFPDLAAGDYYIQLRVADQAQNTSLSNLKQVTFAAAEPVPIDSVAPQVADNAFLVRNSDLDLPREIGATLTKVNEVDLYLLAGAISDNATPKADLSIQFSNDGTTFGTTTNAQGQVTNAGSKTSLGSLGLNSGYYIKDNWRISQVLGWHTIYAKLSDEAGNSVVIETSIRLDENVVTPDPDPGTYTAGTYTVSPFSSPNDTTITFTVQNNQSARLLASRYNTVPEYSGTSPEGLTPLKKVVDLTLAPESAIQFPITIRVYFTQSELDAVAAADSQIVGLGYQAADSNWHLFNAAGESSQVVLNSDRPGYAGYVETTVTHLTPIAVLVDNTLPSVPAGLSASVDGTTANLSWTPVADAAKYEVSIQAVGDPSIAKIETAAAQVTITGLDPNKTYIISVVAIDAVGNRSAAASIGDIAAKKSAGAAQAAQTGATATQAEATKTTTTPTKPVGAPELGQAPVSPAPSPSPTPTVSPSPSPSPSSEEGEVDGTAEETTTSDKTPWIVLGVLILLAAAATAGYFYWFRDEEEIPEERITTRRATRNVPPPERAERPTKPTEEKEKAPPEDKDKKEPPARW